jgi:multiple sugar transport system substrate-binding protein
MSNSLRASKPVQEQPVGWRRFARRSRTAVVVAVVAATSLVAAACGGGGSQSNSSGGDAQTITFWSPPQAGQSESGTKELLKPLVDDFKAESGITVNVEVVDWSSLLSKLTAAIASNTGPDVASGGNTWNGIYTNTGGITSWTPEMIQQIGGLDQYIPAFTKTMGYPGKDPISIPIGGGTWEMVYNKKILADAGITKAPTTWDEFIADAQKTTDPAKGIWGTSVNAANVSDMTTWEWILMRQYGGDFFDAGTKKANANSPQNVQAMQFFLDWIGKYKIMSPQAAQYNAAQSEAEFNNGKLAFLFTQGRGNVTMDQDKYEAARLPMREENPPADQAVMSHIAGENVILFKSSKKQDAAIKWVKFLLSTKAQVTKNVNNKSIPVTVEAGKAPEFSKYKIDKIDIEIASKYAQPQQINSDDGPLSQAYTRAIGQLAGQVATGKTVTEADIKAALDGVQAAALAREASQ